MREWPSVSVGHEKQVPDLPGCLFFKMGAEQSAPINWTGMMEILILWGFLSLVAGAIADNKGRDFFGFLLLSIILSPLIGIVSAALASPNTEVLDKRKLKSGKVKRCPFCAEIIKAKAITCRYCGKDLPDHVGNEKGKVEGYAPLAPKATEYKGKVADNHQAD